MLAVLCAAVLLRISGAMCSLTLNTIKCFLAFTRNYLPQFCVSILLKNYEGRLSLKTQLKIEFLLNRISVVQKCLKISLKAFYTDFWAAYGGKQALVDKKLNDLNVHGRSSMCTTNFPSGD